MSWHWKSKSEADKLEKQSTSSFLLRNELLKIDIQPNENLKVYEQLKNNLSYLKDSFGYKIKREDDETNIYRNKNSFLI